MNVNSTPNLDEKSKKKCRNPKKLKEASTRIIFQDFVLKIRCLFKR